MVAHAFEPSTQEAALCEFKASLVYRASSRTARATQRNPVLKNQKTKPTKNIMNMYVYLVVSLNTAIHKT